MFSNYTFQWISAGAILASASAAAWAQEPAQPSLMESGTFYNSIWAIGIFLVMFFVLGRLVWKPAMQVLKEREKLIQDEISQAQAQKSEAEQLLAQYKAQLAGVEAEAAEHLRQVRAQAEQMRQEILVTTRQQAEHALRGATAEIEAARKAAIDEISALGAELATAAARAIIQKELSPEDHRRIVQESLDEIRLSASKGWAN
jgi:F-type H+-transporting ATPase subunit b